MLTPDIPIKILDFAATIALNKIKKIQERPNVTFDVKKGSYKIVSHNDKEDVLLKLTILFKNIGKSPTSVIDVVTCINYNQEILNNEELYRMLGTNTLILRSKRLDNPVPLELGPGVAKIEEFQFEFKNLYTLCLERCIFPVSPFQFCEMLNNKIKWMEWSYNLPIKVIVASETLTQIIENITWVYREDQEESKIIRGTLDYKEIG